MATLQDYIEYAVFLKYFIQVCGKTLSGSGDRARLIYRQMAKNIVKIEGKPKKEAK